jgi:hypothetical protein
LGLISAVASEDKQVVSDLSRVSEPYPIRGHPVVVQYNLYLESVNTITLYLSQHVSVHFDHLQVIFKYPSNKNYIHNA